jgi:hypothetical protein
MSMRELRDLSLVTSLSLLAACVHGGGVRPLHPLELATSQYSEAVTSARTGSLMYEGGCLLFREDDGGKVVLPVWPDGSIFNGTSVIFHEPAKADQPVVLGQEFVMEGQEARWDMLPAANYASFRHQCAAQPFFVSRVRPAD